MMLYFNTLKRGRHSLAFVKITNHSTTEKGVL